MRKRKMSRRIISTIIVMILCLAMLIPCATSVFAADEFFQQDDFTYDESSTEVDYDSVDETLNASPEESNETVVSSDSDATVESTSDESVHIDDINDNRISEDIIENVTDGTENFQNDVYESVKEAETVDDIDSNVIDDIEVQYVEDAEESGTILNVENEDGDITVTASTGEIDIEQSSDTSDILSNFSLSNTLPSLDDGSWDDYDCTYSYNYDTSSAAQWGAWGGNGNLQGECYDDTQNNDISNKIGVCTDGDVVKVYVKYASLFTGTGNGNDYNISIDGENTKYRVVLDDGTDLSGATLSPGTYTLRILNGGGDISGSDAAGAYGVIKVYEGNLHNEMEISIPISTLKLQNDNVDTSNIGLVTFYSPNIMMGTLSCGGASTSPFLLCVGMLVVAIIFVKNNRGFLNAKCV